MPSLALLFLSHSSKSEGGNSNAAEGSTKSSVAELNILSSMSRKSSVGVFTFEQLAATVLWVIDDDEQLVIRALASAVHVPAYSDLAFLACLNASYADRSKKQREQY
jgi:hypothetical protein